MIYDIKVSSLCAQTSHFFRTFFARFGHFLEMGVWSGRLARLGHPLPQVLTLTQVKVKLPLLWPHQCASRPPCPPLCLWRCIRTPLLSPSWPCWHMRKPCLVLGLPASYGTRSFSLVSEISSSSTLTCCGDYFFSVMGFKCSYREQILFAATSIGFLLAYSIKEERGNQALLSELSKGIRVPCGPAMDVTSHPTPKTTYNMCPSGFRCKTKLCINCKLLLILKKSKKVSK